MNGYFDGESQVCGCEEERAGLAGENFVLLYDHALLSVIAYNFVEAFEYCYQ